MSHGWTTEAYEFGLGVLCFLYATRASGLLYQRLPRLELSCWFDSSWGAEPRPMAGYVIFLNGVPVAWSARKLKIVPLSSCEAETAAGCNASKALLFVRTLLNFMGAVVPVPIAMYTDNEATRIAVRNPGATQRTRFFEMWMTALRKLQLRVPIDCCFSARFSS